MQETHMTSFQLFEVLNLILFIYFDMIFILFTENDSIYDKKTTAFSFIMILNVLFLSTLKLYYIKTNIWKNHA